MRRTAQIIVALDVDTHKEAMRWVRLLSPRVKIFKVGLQLYTASGPKIIQDIRRSGAQVFLDLKFNDIPNTMECAAKEALRHKVKMLTVHTLAGPAALKQVAAACRGKTKLLGVTLLTSICQHFLNDIGIKRSLRDEVLYLARMAKRCGLDGVVCSVQEAALIRKKLGKDFLIVTPGIRPASPAGGPASTGGCAKKDDQKRAATPQDAFRAGSDFLVVGRPVLKAKDPLAAVQEMIK